MMKLLVLLAVAAFVAVQIGFSTGEEFVCQQNVSYIENECNGCFCGQSGGLACTAMGCLGPDRSRLYNCKLGTSWEKDCNKCWCVKNMGTICTNKKC